VRQIYHSREKLPSAAGGTLQLLDLTRQYGEFSMRQAGVAPGDLDGLSVVLDGFHGSAGPELFAALDRAGARIEPLRLVPDGNFPSGSPNPTSRGKMDQAVGRAGEKNCDVVLGIDGDGDRIVFGDRRGILTAGFAAVPILRGCGISAAAPAAVLYDPKVSPLALAEWSRLGAKPVLFRNGHSQIKDYMTRIGAIAAAEESGHYYHRIAMGKMQVSTENSALTVLLFLRALRQQPKLMEHLWDMERRIFATGEFNYQFADDATRDRALEAVVHHFAAAGAQVVTATPDGTDLQGTCLSQGVNLTPGSVKLENGWYSGYLRIATNEKGVVRSYFSAADAAAGGRVQMQTRHLLEGDFAGKVID
jgi:phosphomannomutase